MEIINVAIKVRKYFETSSIPKNELASLYLKYNPLVKDIDNFIEQAFILFPALNCGLATVYLLAKLQKGKPINGKYQSYPHTFLLLERDTIVDITADQFGGPRVYVGQLQSPWKL
jgi:hypothetical protein